MYTSILVYIIFRRLFFLVVHMKDTVQHCINKNAWNFAEIFRIRVIDFRSIYAWCHRSLQYERSLQMLENNQLAQDRC